MVRLRVQSRDGWALLGLLLLTAACASSSRTTRGGLDIKPEEFGRFQCVDRGAVATAPPDVLRMGMVRGEKQEIQRRLPKPLVTKRLCPDGKVPAFTEGLAKPTVAKGNPLLGKSEISREQFFRGTAAADLVRRSLLPIEKVYTIPPGPDDKPHAVPDDPPGCNGTSSFGTCYYYGPASYSRTADGGGMTMRIDRPNVVNGGHTLDEIAVQGGAGNGNIVELGWNVSTSQYGDADPHLFVFHWINWAPTCYDACNWHQYSGTYSPGMNLRALRGREVYIGYVYYQGNWWAWFDNQWLGYFPGSEWSGGYTQNAMIQWFGEVATDNGIPPNTEMGNGQFPTVGTAARNSTLCDVDAHAWVCWYRDLQSLGPNYPPYYDIRRVGFGDTRYGGPGH